MSCPQCGHMSGLFESLMFLSVPVPDVDKFRVLEVTFMPYLSSSIKSDEMLKIIRQSESFPEHICELIADMSVSQANPKTYQLSVCSKLVLNSKLALILQVLKSGDITHLANVMAMTVNVPAEELIFCDIWKGKVHRVLKFDEEISIIRPRTDDIYCYPAPPAGMVCVFNFMSCIIC